MPLILKLNPPGFARLHGDVFGNTFYRLDAGRFIKVVIDLMLRVLKGFVVAVADIGNALILLGVAFAVEPITIAVRLQLRLGKDSSNLTHGDFRHQFLHEYFLTQLPVSPIGYFTVVL